MKEKKSGNAGHVEPVVLCPDKNWNIREDTDGWYCGECELHLKDSFEGFSALDGTMCCSEECKYEYDMDT